MYLPQIIKNKYDKAHSRFVKKDVCSILSTHGYCLPQNIALQDLTCNTISSFDFFPPIYLRNLSDPNYY